MLQVLRAVDKANGYCFGDVEERNLQALMSAAVGADFHFDLYPCSVVTLTLSGSPAARAVQLHFTAHPAVAHS